MPVPQVSGAILKFMAEFVLNKTQRLTFDSSSPNGILLFRQVSKVRATGEIARNSQQHGKIWTPNTASRAAALLARPARNHADRTMSVLPFPQVPDHKCPDCWIVKLIRCTSADESR